MLVPRAQAGPARAAAIAVARWCNAARNACGAKTSAAVAGSHSARSACRESWKAASGRSRPSGPISPSFDDLEAVLAETGMALENLVRLNVYPTGAGPLFRRHGTLPASTTMLGVPRLAIPALLVELEGTAVADR
ncbi:RidA family protein [Amycolatopsis rubida]|uniref:RidA family protein n=1 Tax=Amycolatopsis rubida TaxID=112413 RepID=A0A1I5HY82_9PSEU|nr:RidA family protein [Amycolatopsis rubida]SFO53294.1 hypothetical protein SAMN05421854_102157 [Amycolatopsis rubida]